MRKVILAILVIIVTACNSVVKIKEAFVSRSPYDQYVADLESSSFKERPMVRQWISAGARALADSIYVSLPFSESGQFLSHSPEARAYRFDARDGQILKINGATTATGDTQVFLDLFIWKDNKWKHQSASDSSLTLSYEFRQDAHCLVRMQPELLVNAYYSIVLSLTPVLKNPVSGASNKSIQSFYGDPREGGKRSHEGIDIFAKKGTPIVAPTDGVISRVGQSRLGGKVVWMYDRKREHSYYFAHLDSQYVQPGKVVRQGDTLGTVGNTGNARFTPPHLHFGIYQSRSKDPLHYIKELEAAVESPAIDTTFAVNAFKVDSRDLELRSGPSANSSLLRTLSKDSFVRVLGQSKDWFRVALADNSEGFVPRTKLSPLHSGKPVKIITETQVLSGVSPQSTILDFLQPETEVKVLAHHESFMFIQTNSGLEGWILL